MATSGPPARPWLSLPAAASVLMPLGRPHHGRCLLMQACLQGDGCMRPRPAGSLRLTGNGRRWRNSWATGAMRRQDSSPIPDTAPPIRDWRAASRGTRITFSPSSFSRLKTAVLVNRALEGVRAIVYLLEDWLTSAGLLPAAQRFVRSLDDDRKGAEEVNREFLLRLAKRAQQERPFFAFMNYYDAHYPYQLPPGRLHRFGVEPTDSYQRLLIQQWGPLDKTTVSPTGVAFVTDAYDDCIADLDERLGKLVDELGRRGVLERTWLIIASDHGEAFGEHTGYFGHGMSLYDTELHVPLLIIPPEKSAAKLAINEAVSLRDLATTIVDMVGAEAGSPFPGASLARFWKQAAPVAPNEPPIASQALGEVVPNNPEKRDDWGLPLQLPALAAVKEKDWSYIRREGQIREELFHLSQDPGELRNLADDPSAQTTLRQMRAALDRLTQGPLLPERFNP